VHECRGAQIIEREAGQRTTSNGEPEKQGKIQRGREASKQNKERGVRKKERERKPELDKICPSKCMCVHLF